MSAADDEEEVDAGWIDDFLQESREDAPMQPYLTRVKKPHKTSVGRRGSKKSKKARCAAAASLHEAAPAYPGSERASISPPTDVAAIATRLRSAQARLWIHPLHWRASVGATLWANMTTWASHSSRSLPRHRFRVRTRNRGQ